MHLACIDFELFIYLIIAMLIVICKCMIEKETICR